MMKDNQPSRVFRTLRVKIIKPLDRSWNELGDLLRDRQWKVWQLANMMMTAAAMAWQENRNLPKVAKPKKPPTVAQLNKSLGSKLKSEGKEIEGSGAVNSYITDGLHSFLSAELSGSKWKEFLRGERSLPTFRRSMPIPIRGGEGRFDPVYWDEQESGYVFRPRITNKPYPKILVGVPPKDTAAAGWLKKLAENPDQLMDGWRQKSFSISKGSNGVWWLNIVYDKPSDNQHFDPDRVVGVKLGYNTPLTAVCGENYIGHKDTGWIGNRIKTLREKIAIRRRSVQMGGRKNNGVRGGRGVKRKLAPTELLQGRIDDAQTTYNHVMSRMVVDLAMMSGAGTIHVEDLSSLKQATKGTFLGINWRYFQLQEQIIYKAKEYGIAVVKVAPSFTVQRCSCCGWINENYDKITSQGRFSCVNEKCKDFEKDVPADWNASKNLSLPSIEREIARQLKKQKIKKG